MYRQAFSGLSLSLVFLVVALLWRPPREASVDHSLVLGRNNTVLFLTSEHPGLRNVHIATAFALVENHPTVDIHYASFPRLEGKIREVSDAAQAKNPSSSPIQWHALPGPDMMTSFRRFFGGPNGMVELPGARGMGKKVRDFSALLTSWTAEEHWIIYKALIDLIDDVDPSLIVIDHVFKPATDLPGNVNRRFITISPNSLLDLIPDRQPWGGMFWRFPAIATGYRFPVPWHLVPANIFINLRIILGMLTVPGMGAVRAYLEEKGIKDPLAFGLYPKRTQLFASSVPEVNFPMDFIPPEISFYGPIVLETRPAMQQDPELMRWLAESDGKTMLVNLGTLYDYNETRARQLAEALAKVLDKVDGSRILWKFSKDGEFDERPALEPLKKFIKNGRARVVPWLKVDPSSLLTSGHIDLFVNHGGGNSYHEGIFAGVPQVMLPIWFDCYNFASTAEYLGIGIWPGRDTAPMWDPDTIAKGIVRGLIGEESMSLKRESQALAAKARSYGGRNFAAREVARLAAHSAGT